MQKVLIIGAGISGLSVANMLKNKNLDITIFEKKSHAGGIIHCKRVDDYLYHLIGGHVFNSKNQDILNWFWSFFDKDSEFISAKRNAKVLWDNSIVGYPFEDNVHLLSDSIVKSVINDWLQLQNTNRPSNPLEYNDFESFLLNQFGKTLYDIYFKPYNHKIWQTDLKNVPMQWLEGKLPMPKVHEMLFNNIVKKEESSMVHSTFYYPKNNGSQFIIDRLAQNVNIIYNTEIKSLEFIKNKWIVNQVNEFDSIIYTGDIRLLPQIIQNKSINTSMIRSEEFPSNTTSNILCKTDTNDISWLYIPNPEVKAHRIIYTGNFSDSNNRKDNRRSCVVEFSGNTSPEIMKEQIKLLPGNLEPISWNQEVSYIIHTHKTYKIVNQVKSELESYQFYLLGRFAEWEYFNMDKCMESAMKLAHKFV